LVKIFVGIEAKKKVSTLLLFSSNCSCQKLTKENFFYFVDAIEKNFFLNKKLLLTFDFLRGVNAKEQFDVPNGTTTTTKKL
jgi:hypothetical protein